MRLATASRGSFSFAPFTSGLLNACIDKRQQFITLENETDRSLHYAQAQEATVPLKCTRGFYSYKNNNCLVHQLSKAQGETVHEMQKYK